MQSFVYRAPFSDVRLRIFISVLAGFSFYLFAYQKADSYQDVISIGSGVCGFLIVYAFLKEWSKKKITFEQNRMLFEGFSAVPSEILASSVSEIQIVQSLSSNKPGRIEFVIRETNQKVTVPQMNDENWKKVTEWFDGIRLVQHLGGPQKPSI